MRKVKLDAKKAANMHEDKAVTLLGKTVTVRNHIPYEQKLNLAEGLVNATAMLDDDEIMVLDSHVGTAVEALMLLKYYTNVDTDSMTPDDAHNIMMNTGEWGEVKDFCMEDFGECLYIAEIMMTNIKELYDRQKSLGYAVLKSYGFLFDGRDISESMEDGIALRDELVDVFQKIRGANQTEQNKVDGSKMKIGGAVIDLTPKA